MDLVQLEIEERGEVVIARVTGELDLAGAPSTGEAIGEAVPTSARALVVDFTGLEFIDSSGIAMLFNLARRLGSRRQELRVVASTASPSRACWRSSSSTAPRRCTRRSTRRSARTRADGASTRRGRRRRALGDEVEHGPVELLGALHVRAVRRARAGRSAGRPGSAAPARATSRPARGCRSSAPITWVGTRSDAAGARARRGGRRPRAGGRTPPAAAGWGCWSIMPRTHATPCSFSKNASEKVSSISSSTWPSREILLHALGPDLAQLARPRAARRERDRQRQRAHALGRGERHLLGDRPAHRHAEQVEGVQLERVGERERVLRHVPDLVRGRRPSTTGRRRGCRR